MARRRKICGITLGLLNPEKITRLSHGEITLPKTLDSLTMRPIPGGLFCPRIFGPAETGRCHCGKYSGSRKKGLVCGNCGVEVGDPRVRKERPGHIALVSPVVHSWFRRTIAVLADIPPRRLEDIIRCRDYIVSRSGASPYKRKAIISHGEYLKYKGCKGFRAETGGSAVRQLLQKLDISGLAAELRNTPPSRRTMRRLKIVEAFRTSGSRPEWMAPDVLIVLPPGLRPILTTEDGALVSSDLNDLYLKVIIRNNRLKRFSFIGAPELILNNERRLLQEAVDALFDNAGKHRMKDRSGRRALKSLSDMLKSKQGRLRRNLLGKRVDYSGRSVIVAGPELRLDQCGIPKEMAMDMFRPFIYGKLMRTGSAATLKHARALVDSRSPEAFSALEKVMKGKVVLLNRAPSLHRMNVQAFRPVPVEGLAIRLHPLVCPAFNADFDGDQMGVHIPLSSKAQREAETLMLSTCNILSPAHGDFLALPAQDMVLGIYYLTHERNGCRGEGMFFADKEDVITAHQHGVVEEQARIRLRFQGKRIETTPGRVILSEAFPGQFPFELLNRTLKKRDLGKLLEICYEEFGREETIALLDRVKDIGFRYATLSGLSLCADDMVSPKEKGDIIAAAEQEVKETGDLFSRGLITTEERYNKIIDAWNSAAGAIAGKLEEALGPAENRDPGGKECRELNSFFIMADSGARGALQQFRQIAGMRGLMARPTGEILEIPVKSNLKEGHTCFEFLLAAHGARKGRADGALRTSLAGYFTRRLIDAVGDISITEEDCGTTEGITVSALDDDGTVVIPLEERLFGRVAAEDIVHPVSGEILVRRDEAMSRGVSAEISESGITSFKVRSPATCRSQGGGICSLCYGYDLARRELAIPGDAAGIIAAQSIGEPGTQLTLRTFHSGGSASGRPVRASIELKESGTVRLRDIKTVRRDDGKLVATNRSGYISLVTARGEKEAGAVPCGAVIHVGDGVEGCAGQKAAEWDPFNVPVVSTKKGIAVFSDIVEGLTMRSIKNKETGIPSRKITAVFRDMLPKITIAGEEYFLPPGAILAIKEGDTIGPGEVIAKIPKKAVKTADITGGLSRVLQILEAQPLLDPAVMADISGEVSVCPPDGKVLPVRITGSDGTVREYTVPLEEQMDVRSGDRVKAGEILVDGVIDAASILKILGPERAVLHIVNEVQKVYRSQGVIINDKHIELVARKMLGMVRITDPGDTEFVQGETVSKAAFLETNEKARGRKAAARPVLTGITAVAMNSASWLSAASFQRTVSVLADAAIRKKTDPLSGPKENIIIGSLVPLGTGHPAGGNKYLRKERERQPLISSFSLILL